MEKGNERDSNDHERNYSTKSIEYVRLLLF